LGRVWLLNNSIKSPLLDIVEQTKNADEQVDKIEVQRDGAHDELVRTKLLRDDVGIENNVPAKEEAPSTSVDEVHSLAKGHEHANDTSHHEYKQTAEQEWTHSGKVIFALESKERETEENAKCDQHSLKHDDAVIVGHNQADTEGLEDRKSREHDVVGGVRMALPVKESEGDEGTDEGNEYGPLMHLNPRHGLFARGKPSDYASTKDLDEQDGIDLANERLLDLRRRVGNSHSVLEVIGEIAVVTKGLDATR